jgi:crotonobetainyl-CoA:carnitine CoA-transferase CaiB-like acyl-CoA transferase
VHDIPAALAEPQAVHRGAVVAQPHPLAAEGAVRTVANPIKLSQTPVTYRHAPPTVGQHTAEVLGEVGFEADAVAALARDGVIGLAG